MVVKNILEDLIGKCLKSQYFKTGDGLAKEVGRNNRMPIKFETGEKHGMVVKGSLQLVVGMMSKQWHGMIQNRVPKI